MDTIFLQPLQMDFGDLNSNFNFKSIFLPVGVSDRQLNPYMANIRSHGLEYFETK